MLNIKLILINNITMFDMVLDVLSKPSGQRRRKDLVGKQKIK